MTISIRRETRDLKTGNIENFGGDKMDRYCCGCKYLIDNQWCYNRKINDKFRVPKKQNSICIMD